MADTDQREEPEKDRVSIFCDGTEWFVRLVTNGAETVHCFKNETDARSFAEGRRIKLVLAALGRAT